MRVCKVCSTEKPLEEFKLMGNGQNGRKYYLHTCTVCHKEYNRDAMFNSKNRTWIHELYKDHPAHVDSVKLSNLYNKVYGYGGRVLELAPHIYAKYVEEIA